jgi:DNA recombination protein RmuC
LQKSSDSMNTRLDNATEVVGDLREKVGQIHEVGKAAQELVNIMRAPKLRGGMGELFLGDLLAQILPQEHYSLQHRFKSGEAVDAVIRIGPKLVPADAKFPYENFKRVVEATADVERVAARKQFLRDVKKHVDAIATKYILPDEGTYDFALMYVPAVGCRRSDDCGQTPGGCARASDCSPSAAGLAAALFPVVIAAARDQEGLA